jgi:hypothetical protein
MERIRPPECDLAPPHPWEDRPISCERWRRHRETMLAGSPAGTRPIEWWLYERDMQQPDRQTTWLYDHNELSEAELAELRPVWRQRYEHAHDERFSYNAGTRGWLEGAAARKAWYRLFDIPPGVVWELTAERRRSARTIRNPPTAAHSREKIK